MSNQNKKDQLQKLMNKFCKDHDLDSTTMGFMSENKTLGVIKHISTGNIGIDAITNNGIIEGKVNIIYGGENSCKSTLALDLVAERQRKDPEFIAAICDNEKVFDRIYAESKGIDLSRLWLSPAFNEAEQAYDFCNEAATSGLVDMLIVDTIQALASKGEIVTKKGKKKSTEDDTMALIPRLLSQFLRMYTSQTTGTVTLILLSQVRIDLGGQGMIKSAKKTGGKAIDHYNILTLKLTKFSILGTGNWPHAIASQAEAPPKSFPVQVRIDKAKMQGRFDGNKIMIYFYKGQFEHKFNVLAIAKDLGMHDGKLLKYKKEFEDSHGKDCEIEEEFKAKGFKDMYNRVPDEAISYLASRIIDKYGESINEELAPNDEPEEEQK